MKRTLLLTSFGTSVPEAREGIDAVAAAMRTAAPELELVQAYTSPTIRGILARRGETVPGPEEALERLAGPEREVLVQPTHLLYGVEYDRLRDMAERFRPRFGRLALGRPLLADTEDLQRLARCAAEAYRPAQGALVLLGHGTTHFANAVYPALQTVLRLQGESRVYVGTVEGWPGFDEVLAQLRADGHRQAVLAPLMLVAGDHALHDMAGGEADSWKSRLEAAGIGTTCRMTGLGLLPEVQQMYCGRLRELL